MTMDMKDLYWLAGIIEGEGSFIYPHIKLKDGSKGQGYPRVQVKMTDEDVVRKCQKVAGVGKVHGPHQPPGNRKLTWTWAVTKKVDGTALMQTLYLLMGTRRRSKIIECLQEWLADDHPGCGSVEAAKTHCPQGHPYDEENTFHTNNGRRLCIICHRIYGRKSDAKRRPRKKVSV